MDFIVDSHKRQMRRVSLCVDKAELTLLIFLSHPMLFSVLIQSIIAQSTVTEGCEGTNLGPCKDLAIQYMQS